MDYANYPYSGGRGVRRPAPSGPAGFRPPVVPRSASKFVIDQIAAKDLDDISEAPSGTPSPQPGDNVTDYNIDPAQSPISSPPPWQAEPGDIPTPFTTPTSQVDADGNVTIGEQCSPLETDCDE